MDSMKGLGAALPNRKGGNKGKAAAAEEEDDEEFDPASLSASERKQLQQLVSGGLTGNPELIKALQGRLNGLVGRNSGYSDSLPTKARRGGCAVQAFWRQRCERALRRPCCERGGAAGGCAASRRARGGAAALCGSGGRWVACKERRLEALGLCRPVLRSRCAARR